MGIVCICMKMSIILIYLYYGAYGMCTYSGEHARNRVQQSRFQIQPKLFEVSKPTANGVSISRHKFDVSRIIIAFI